MELKKDMYLRVIKKVLGIIKIRNQKLKTKKY